MTPEQAKQMFQDSGALLEGHFKLHSGRHSRHFCQCALALQETTRIEQLGSALADNFRNEGAEAVVAPAMGGLVIGQEIARQLRLRFLFAEKEEGKLKFRRGFQLKPKEKVVVVDDVLTRGGSLRETIRLVQECGASVIGIAVLVDRSDVSLQFECPLESLIKLPIETFAPDNLPEDLKRIPAVKPGS